LIRFTKKQWDRLPSKDKGRISGEWVAKGVRRAYLGGTTLRYGKKVLFEGIDYVIEGQNDLI
jgi:hypothetical protein